MKRKSRRLYYPTVRVFHRAIMKLKSRFPEDDFTVMNNAVFKTIVEDMKWSYRLGGFTGAAAALFYDLIMDHPLVDGNKRLAASMLIAFLYRNGYELSGSEKLYELAIKVAENKKSKQGVSKWLRKRLRKRY